MTALEGSTYAWTGQDALNRYIAGQYRPLSLSQLIQEVMELEFKEAPPNFSAPFSGHPKSFSILSSYVQSCHRSHEDLRANCSVAHL